MDEYAANYTNKIDEKANPTNKTTVAANNAASTQAKNANADQKDDTEFIPKYNLPNNLD